MLMTNQEAKERGEPLLCCAFWFLADPPQLRIASGDVNESIPIMNKESIAPRATWKCCGQVWEG